MDLFTGWLNHFGNLTTIDKIWLTIGFLGQAMFASRFIVQWLVSEKKQKSVVPIQFWFLSLAGGIILLLYATHNKDIVIMMGQAPGLIVYTRNLMLISKHKKAQEKAANS